MERIFNAADAAAVSKLIDGDNGAVSTLIIDVVGNGWIGSLKVKGRAIGRARAHGAGAAAADFTAYLKITNLNDGSEIDGDTGITETGLYQVDIAGLEVLLDLDASAGDVTVYVHPVVG